MAWKLPNGYGSIIKLTGKRRKPYAVRITIGTSWDPDRERLTQKYKYLEYFEKRADAVLYLANYNSGMRVKEHQSLQDALTLAQVYERWIAEKEASKRGLSDKRRGALAAAFKKFAALHKKKIRNIRLADVQPIFDANRDMSRGTTQNMSTVISGIYHYAMRYDLVDNDFTDLLITEGSDSKQIHFPFTEQEIRILWEHRADKMARFILITIYSGMRPTELLIIKSEDIDIKRRIIIGGIKTDAGRDRVIPIHEKIVPLLSEGLDFNYNNYTTFLRDYTSYVEAMGMEHLPHDGRHTCATLMEAAGVPQNRRKLILGHKIDDVTDGTYTHVDPGELVKEINKITI